jgi:hypothetical protein
VLVVFRGEVIIPYLINPVRKQGRTQVLTTGRGPVLKLFGSQDHKGCHNYCGCRRQKKCCRGGECVGDDALVGSKVQITRDKWTWLRRKAIRSMPRQTQNINMKQLQLSKLKRTV